MPTCSPKRLHVGLRENCDTPELCRTNGVVGERRVAGTAAFYQDPLQDSTLGEEITTAFVKRHWLLSLWKIFFALEAEMNGW